MGNFRTLFFNGEYFREIKLSGLSGVMDFDHFTPSFRNTLVLSLKGNLVIWFIWRIRWLVILVTPSTLFFQQRVNWGKPFSFEEKTKKSQKSRELSLFLSFLFRLGLDQGGEGLLILGVSSKGSLEDSS